MEQLFGVFAVDRARRFCVWRPGWPADVTQITMHLGYQCCQRLIAARMLPGRDGQPVHVQVHVDLATLRGLPGAPDGPGGPGPEAGWRPGLEAGWSRGQAAGWSPARAAVGPGSVYLTGADAEAAACDATITPAVSGQVDWTALDQLTTLFLKAHGCGRDHHRDPSPASRQGGSARATAEEPYELSPALRQRLRDTLLQMSINLLSGPGGLASCTATGHPATRREVHA